MAAFESTQAAKDALKSLQAKIGTSGLRFVRESFGMKYQMAALSGVQRTL